MITNSLDWAQYESSLRHKIKGLKYSRDVGRMIDNISSEISSLSKAEISARRGKTSEADRLLTKINNDIDMVEEFILVAALMG